MTKLPWQRLVFALPSLALLSGLPAASPALATTYSWSGGSIQTCLFPDGSACPDTPDFQFEPYSFGGTISLSGHGPGAFYWSWLGASPPLPGTELPNDLASFDLFGWAAPNQTCCGGYFWGEFDADLNPLRWSFTVLGGPPDWLANDLGFGSRAIYYANGADFSGPGGTIAPIPLPAAGWLLGFGVAVLLAMQKLGSTPNVRLTSATNLAPTTPT